MRVECCFCIKVFNKCLALEMKMFYGGKWNISESDVSQIMTKIFNFVSLGHPAILCEQICHFF